MMQFLHTRGNQGASIVSFDERHKIFRVERGHGDIRNALKYVRWENFTGKSAIGHLLYSTVQNLGLPKTEYLQPIKSKSGRFHLGHNGTLEPRSLKKLMDKYGPKKTDSEAIVDLIDELYGKFGNWDETLRGMDKSLDGSYTCLMIAKYGHLIGFREPRGLKPLNYGEVMEDGKVVGYAIASETTPLRVVAKSPKIRSLDPGSYIIINEDGIRVDKFAKPMKHAHCSFEFVYFQKFASEFEGVSNDLVRYRLGQALARKDKGRLKADSVGPVPHSGSSAARGYSQESGLPLAEYLDVNPVGRTFISAPDERNDKLNIKYAPVEYLIKDKKIVVVDDSIVRSSTIAFIVGMLKEYGAKEVHVRISFPPIRYPCLHGGIAFSKTEELGMNIYGDVDGLRKVIGADSLVYTNIRDLKSATGMSDLCTACINGVYPLKKGEVKFEEMKRRLPVLQHYVSG